MSLKDKIIQLINKYGEKYVIKQLHINMNTLNKILNNQTLSQTTGWRIKNKLQTIFNFDVVPHIDNEVDKQNKQIFLDYFENIIINNVKQQYKQQIDEYIKRLAIKHMQIELHKPSSTRIYNLLNPDKIIYDPDIDHINSKYNLNLQHRQKSTHKQDVKKYLKNTKQTKTERVRTTIPQLANDHTVLNYSQQFGLFINKLRKQIGLSLPDFAKKFGTNTTHLWKIEKGLSVYIPVKLFKKLNEYFGKQISTMFKENINV